MSVQVGTSAGVLLFSVAQTCLAASISRRLLRQLFLCATSRARTKLGSAIAASIPAGTAADAASAEPPPLLPLPTAIHPSSVFAPTANIYPALSGFMNDCSNSFIFGE